jgi:hypothetical protein
MSAPAIDGRSLLVKRVTTAASLRLLLAAVFLFPALPLHAVDAVQPEALIASLRQGGYVIYFRHAATEWS